MRSLLSPRFALVLAFGMALVPLGALAEEEKEESWFPGEFSANVAIGTDYPFRGISQTGEDPAVSGGIDLNFPLTDEIGLYFGSWGSNVNFGDGDQAQLELDIYGGLSAAFGDFSADFLVVYYEYPGARSRLRYDYWELGPTLGYDFGFMSTSVQYLWSPDFFAGAGDGHVVYGGIAVPAPEGMLPSWLGASIDANVGGQFFDEDATFGTRDYAYWDAGATLSAFGLDVDLRYVDTDLSSVACFGGTKLCQGRFVTTVGASF